MSQKDHSYPWILKKSQRNTVPKKKHVQMVSLPHPNSHFIQQLHPKFRPKYNLQERRIAPPWIPDPIWLPQAAAGKPLLQGTEFINHRRYSSFCDASHNLSASFHGAKKNAGQQDELLVGGWTTPSEKLCNRPIGFTFFPNRDEHKQYLSCHHLELILHSLHSLKLTVRTWK